MKRSLLCLAALCLTLAAQTPIEPRIVSETLPAGGMMQIKLELTTPHPIVVGGGSFESREWSDGYDGVSLFSPNSDAYGVAWVDNGRFRSAFSSPLASLGTQLDYPFLVAASRIKPGLAAGSKYTISLDASSFFGQPGGGSYTITNPKDGVLTIGGSVSITNVIPGGGIVPVGGVVRLLGTGFNADTSVNVNNAIVTSLTLIGSTELRFTLDTAVQMEGLRIRAKNKDNSEATYYSYPRPSVLGASGNSLLNSAHPLFLPARLTLAGLTVPAVPSGGFSAIALQNNDTIGSDVQMQLISPSGSLIASAGVTMPAGSRWARTMPELFNVVPSSGSVVRLTASQGVQVLGLASNPADNSLSAFTTRAAPPLPPPADEMTLLPSSLAFSYQIGGSLPAAKSISVSNSGSASRSFTTSITGNWLSVDPAGGTTPSVINVSVNPSGLPAGRYNGSVTVTPSGGLAAKTLDVILDVAAAPVQNTTGLYFVPVKPCRLADTRENLGAFGKPALVAGVARSFTIPDAPCGVPADARAYSLNVTVVPKGPLGYITIWPTGQPQPFVSTLNSVDGRVKANAALVPAGAGGAVSVIATDATELVLDINGYFREAASLAFYPVTPCRIADTRNAGGALTAGATRTFAMLSNNCALPASAQAWAVNVTVVPQAPLGYISMWPAGQTQPLVSTLNAPTGAIVANAAIVPAGANGDLSIFAQGPTHIVLDVNGYFAAPGAANAQRFFAVPPCRLLDTREAAGQFGGPVLDSAQTRSYPLPSAACGLPSSAKAYSLNATVVPETVLGYLTMWPSGQAQPFVSTLNATDDKIVANAALVPAGSAGAVSSFVTNRTHLVLDTNGYFAP